MNRRIPHVVLLLVIVLLASGCGQAPAAAPADESPQEPADGSEPAEPPAPTATTAPTQIPEPTATPAPTETPAPTALPQGVLFRDDFSGELLAGWQWINEDPARWSMTDDGWLQITGDNPSFFSSGDNISLVNFLTRDLPEGEFEIRAHLRAEPSENFQQATIFIFEDPNNYIALNIGFCDLCLEGGNGYFMETFIDNNPFGDAYIIPRDAAETDVYLRLVNADGSLTGYRATQPDQWQRVGAFGNYFEFELVGLGVTNSNQNGVAQDLVGQFDYFEIREP